MIFVYQLLCFIGAITILGILIMYHPINSNIQSAIMTSILALFFGAGALSIKESLTRKGGKIPWAHKIIGILILLGMFGYGYKYFIALWNGEDIKSKREAQEVVAATTDTATDVTATPLSTDSLADTYSLSGDTATSSIYDMIEEPENYEPTLAGKFVLVWLLIVCLFLLWIMAKGGEDVEVKTTKK